jgi:hypothetical protein
LNLAVEKKKLEKLYFENEKQLQREYVESLHNSTADKFPNIISPRTVGNGNIPMSTQMFAALGIKTTANSPHHNTKMLGFSQKDEDTLSSKLLPVPSNKASLAF